MTDDPSTEATTGREPATSAEAVPDVAVRHDAQVLDLAVFGRPFILIDATNTAVLTTDTHDSAHDAIHNHLDVAAAVGTLHPDLTGVDIDPTDSNAPPEAGNALADDLTTWLDRLGLPWLQRNSGRPGHHHVIAAIPRVLHREFTRILNRAKALHRVDATQRRSLRLLTSAHRHGHPAAHITGTLEAADLPPATPPRAAQPARPRKLRTRPPTRPTGHRSRSEHEYGDTLALIRAHIPVDQAWTLLNQPGSKARDIGYIAWRRWYWAPATTIVAAEHGTTEHQAWETFHNASPTQARHLGRTRWREQRWLPALHEAACDRPRRTRIRPVLGLIPACRDDRTGGSAAVLAVRQALHRTVDCLTAAGRIPGSVREQSLRATLDALAQVLVDRQGSVSVRAWAEAARLDPKTIRKARDISEELGVIARTHQYHGGPHDSDIWAPGPAVAQTVLASESQSHTQYAPTYGRANAHQLRLRHAIERMKWENRASVRRQKSVEVTRKRYSRADSNTHVQDFMYRTSQKIVFLGPTQDARTKKSTVQTPTGRARPPPRRKGVSTPEVANVS